jgi:two-component system, chemotaxis family, sensor kinase CheA
MRRKAVEQNLLTDEQAAALSDQEAQELVFTVVHDDGDGSDSGVRYVGINLIVQRLRDELQANVTVQSTIGQGTAIVIAIPLMKH